MSTCICIGVLVLAADAAAWVLTAETGDSRWVVLITSGSGAFIALCTAIVVAAPHMAKAATAFATAVFPVLQLIWKQRDELTGETKKLRRDLAENTKITEAAQEAARKLGEEAKEAARRNTETIERLLEQNKKLAEQNEKLQATIEEDRESTNKARETLHAIRDEFNTATLQHREQREALIAEVAAMTDSLTAARAEIAEFHRRDQARMSTVVAGQARQDVRIEQNKVAVAEVTATVERITGGSSQEIPVVKVDVDDPRNSEPPATEKPS